jgi:hypothetical protein
MSNFSFLSDSDIIKRVRNLADQLDDVLIPALEESYKTYDVARSEYDILMKEIEKRTKERKNEDEK